MKAHTATVESRPFTSDVGDGELAGIPWISVEESVAIHRRVKVERILVPIDLSDTSRPLMQWAAVLAEGLGAQLTALFVYPESWLQRGSSESTEADPNADLAREAEDQIQRLYREVAIGANTLETRFRVGNPAREIVRVAEAIAADLIIVSWHGRGGWRRLVHSQVAERVVRRAPCPVFTVSEEVLKKGGILERAWPFRWKTILTPVDFSEGSRSVVGVAGGLAAGVGARLALLHVIGRSGLGSRMTLANQRKTRNELQGEVEGRLSAWAGSVVPTSVPMSNVVPVGLPFSRVLESTVRRVGPELIVVRTPRGSWWRVPSGDLAAYGLLSRARCPVLHVPDGWEGGSGRTGVGGICGAEGSESTISVGIADRTEELPVGGIRQVLVAVDLPVRDRRILQRACALVPAGGRLRLVHVVHPDALPGGEYVQGIRTTRSEMVHQDYIRFCQRQLKALMPRGAALRGVLCDLEVVEHREVARAIGEAADRFGADLICLGSREETRLGGLVRGSIGHAFMVHSQRPVLKPSRELELAADASGSAAHGAD